MFMPIMSLMIRRKEVNIIDINRFLLYCEVLSKFIQLLIKLFKPRVLADKLRHDLLHEADHVVDFDLTGEAFEFVDTGKGVCIIIFANFCDADAAVVCRKSVLVG